MSDAQSKLKISQEACGWVGVNLTSLSENTVASRFINMVYEPLLEAEIALYPWRFATAEYDLGPNLLNETPLNTAFDTVYQEPSDLIQLDTVLNGDVPIHYERRGRKIHTRVGGDNPIAIYRYRANELDWSPTFRQLMVYRLATGVAFSVQRKADVASEMKDLGDEHWSRAKTMDAQSQTNQKMRLNIIKGRRRGFNKFWRYR